MDSGSFFQPIMRPVVAHIEEFTLLLVHRERGAAFCWFLHHTRIGYPTLGDVRHRASSSAIQLLLCRKYKQLQALLKFGTEGQPGNHRVCLLGLSALHHQILSTSPRSAPFHPSSPAPRTSLTTHFNHIALSKSPTPFLTSTPSHPIPSHHCRHFHPVIRTFQAHQ